MNKTKWYAKGVYWLVGLALVASLCLMLAGPVFAATVTGYSDKTTSGQTIKASSDATPLLGINVTNTTAGETLSSVFVSFTNVNGFTPDDLASSIAGVTIYVDNGTVNGTFDAGDSDIGTGVTWNYTALTAVVSTSAAAIPVNDTDVNAGDDFFVVIKTSSNITTGDQFTAYLGTNSVTTSAGTTGVTQVTTNTITADTVAPTIDTNTLLTPSAAGIYIAGGSSYNITWNATKISDTNLKANPITLDYYNGTAWIQIATGEANDGTYTWTVPSLDISTAKVNITATDEAGNTASDVSDNNFTIDSTNPTVTVTTPSATGIYIAGGSSYNITWNATDNNFGASPITLDYYNGTAWVQIATGEANDGTYSWTVPSLDISTAKVNITATDEVGKTASDVSDNNFTIDSTNPTVAADALLTPSADGIYIAGGSSYNITWNATKISDTNLKASPITLGYYNGTAWVQIATGEANDGTYTWTVPSLDISTAKVNITATDEAGNTASDVSDNTFTIDSTNPTVTVTSPNGGENWLGGTTHAINWTATDTNLGASPITLGYYNGTAWVQIATGEANDGTYSWTVPNLTSSSNSSLVNITAVDLAGNSGSDQSNATFNITSTSIELYKDWNLISTMLYIPPGNRTPATLLASVLDNVDIVWGDYNPANGTWKTYVPTAPTNDLNETRDGKGYWINMTAADTLNLGALGSELPAPPNAPPSYAVVEGWNLIGFKSTTPKLASNYLAAIDGKYTLIYGYNAADDIYFTVGSNDNLQPGHGYWIAITESGTIYP